MTNKSNSDYSSGYLLDVLKKWDELVEIRNAVSDLFGEDQHHKLLFAIEGEKELRMEARCPSRLLLGMTPNKQQRVIETWDSIVRNMRKTYDERNFSYELNKIKQMKSIEEINNYQDERKNRDWKPVDEKNPGRRFNRSC